MNRAFKPGDVVLCVDASEREELKEGVRYKIASVSGGYVGLEGQDEYQLFMSDRFIEGPLPKVSSELLVIENESVYMFDVDETLVKWTNKFNEPGDGRIAVTDPYDGKTVYLNRHEKHIKLLSSMRGRGRYIGVWSAAGVKWAKAVIEALELTPYVHMILTKPVGYIDDKPSSEWMQHIYIQEEK